MRPGDILIERGRIIYGGGSVRVCIEQLNDSGLQDRLDAWVRDEVGSGPAPKQDDKDLYARANQAVGGITYKMLRRAINQLPQACRRGKPKKGHPWQPVTITILFSGQTADHAL